LFNTEFGMGNDDDDEIRDREVAMVDRLSPLLQPTLFHSHLACI